MFGLSGYSGAGTITVPASSLSSSSSSVSTKNAENDGRPISLPKVTAESLGGGVRPYALTDHINEREAAFHLSRLSLIAHGAATPSEAFPAQGDKHSIKLAFIPAVTPWFSGILSTLSMPLKEPLTAREIHTLYKNHYAGEKLVRVKDAKDGVPSLAEVEGNQGVVIGGVQVHSEGDRVVVVVCVFFLGGVFETCYDSSSMISSFRLLWAWGFVPPDL